MRQASQSVADRELRGVALAVITAKVFLVTDLHEYVAVGRKTKERNREQVQHGGTAGGEPKEQ